MKDLEKSETQSSAKEAGARKSPLCRSGGDAKTTEAVMELDLT